MNLFKFTGDIKSFKTLDQGLKNLNIETDDLIFTSHRVKNEYLSNFSVCEIFCHDPYGSREPSDKKIDSINDELKSKNFKRLIAIGGGSVLDISKILALKGNYKTIDYFNQSVPIENKHPLVAIPTTCGTGSEVTSISIAYIESLETKMGLNHEALFPKQALLIPELLDNIPYEVYIFSAIDALIHAIEAYLSPNSSIYTDVLSKKAIDLILKTFKKLSTKRNNPEHYNVSGLLIASNLAGLAFGNAGVGAIHALSYPLGGKYHVPHGESNYLFLDAVLTTYKKLKPKGKIKGLEAVISTALNCSTEKSFDNLNILLNHLIDRKSLSTYGMISNEVQEFSEIVINTQKRLLKNNYAELSIDHIENIYRNLY